MLELYNIEEGTNSRKKLIFQDTFFRNYRHFLTSFTVILFMHILP